MSTNLKHRKIEDNKLVVENKGVILCSQYTHLLWPDGCDAIHHNDKFEMVDGKEWEVFNVSHEVEDGYYGIPLLGLGIFNCFIRKEDTRKFLPKEIEILNKQKFGIYGSHTGKDSGIRYGGGYEEVVSKFEGKIGR